MSHAQFETLRGLLALNDIYLGFIFAMQLFAAMILVAIFVRLGSSRNRREGQ